MARFDTRSLNNVAQLHPLLQKLFNEAIKEFDFIVADGRRGRIAQTRAFKTGHSKVRFGNSAHNYTPGLAADIYPAPFKNTTPISKFVTMQIKIIKPIAAKLLIPIRQGIDFNMNGNLSDDTWDDAPHVELYPWRTFAKKAKLYEDG